MPNLLILSIRSVLLCSYLFFGVILGLGISIHQRLSGNAGARAPTARFWLKGLCKLLGIRIVLEGALERGTVMLVSNHISWIDIPVIGSLKPIHFLSKSEVRQWPLIGWLADRAGTLFIKRGGGKSGAVGDQLRTYLEGGHSTLIFPEGTTTAGLTVRKFHGRLLKSGVDAGIPLQAVTLCYVRNSQPDRLAAFIEDDDFVPHLIAIMKQPRTVVYVISHPVLAMAGQSATELSLAAENAIKYSLHQLINKHCQPLSAASAMAAGKVVPNLAEQLTNQ